SADANAEISSDDGSQGLDRGGSGSSSSGSSGSGSGDNGRATGEGKRCNLSAATKPIAKKKRTDPGPQNIPRVGGGAAMQQGGEAAVPDRRHGSVGSVQQAQTEQVVAPRVAVPSDHPQVEARAASSVVAVGNGQYSDPTTHSRAVPTPTTHATNTPPTYHQPHRQTQPRRAAGGASQSVAPGGAAGAVPTVARPWMGVQSSQSPAGSGRQGSASLREVPWAGTGGRGPGQGRSQSSSMPNGAGNGRGHERGKSGIGRDGQDKAAASGSGSGVQGKGRDARASIGAPVRGRASAGPEGSGAPRDPRLRQEARAPGGYTSTAEYLGLRALLAPAPASPARPTPTLASPPVSPTIISPRDGGGGRSGGQDRGSFTPSIDVGGESAVARSPSGFASPQSHAGRDRASSPTRRSSSGTSSPSSPRSDRLTSPSQRNRDQQQYSSPPLRREHYRESRGAHHGGDGDLTSRHHHGFPDDGRHRRGHSDDGRHRRHSEDGRHRGLSDDGRHRVQSEDGRHRGHSDDSRHRGRPDDRRESYAGYAARSRQQEDHSRHGSSAVGRSHGDRGTSSHHESANRPRDHGESRPVSIHDALSRERPAGGSPGGSSHPPTYDGARHSQVGPGTTDERQSSGAESYRPVSSDGVGVTASGRSEWQNSPI
ncbi:unnamed protein product, partial [Sphacelaria rigidula]